MSQDPQVSIIIPAYESQETLAASLESISLQNYREIEVILIDSSPTKTCEMIVKEQFPWVLYEHVMKRMLPHEARNYGVQKARSTKLVFTDPDIITPPDWIDQLLAAHAQFGDVIVGSVSCYGTDWFDQAMHMAKFDMWLPGGVARPIDIAPTLNLICTRRIFDIVGGFSGEQMIGDTVFSWDVMALGYRIHFAPRAEVAHHHVSSWSALLRERYHRGKEFGRLRVARSKWTARRTLAHLVLTISPIRWVGLMRRTSRCAREANLYWQFVGSLPIIMSAHAAWLCGEASGFREALHG